MITPTTRARADRLTQLLARENEALADFVLELSAFDRQELWKEYGFTSLFDFLHRELKLSRGAAYFRQVAARLVVRVPEVGEALRDGRLCLMTISELNKVLTEENRAKVLPRFFHCSKQEAKVLSAELCPAENPPARTVVTALPPAPAPRAPTPASIDRGSGSESWHAGVLPVGRSATNEAPAAAAPPPRTETEPLNREQARLHTTVDRTMLAELEELKSLLSQRMPGATTEQLLALAVHELLVAERRKKALVEKPRPAPPPREQPEPGCRDARHVPAAVERAVRLRDQGRCQYRLESGELCGSTYQVELHHTRNWADGGVATVEDLSLRCKPHHRAEAERDFGDGLIAHCIARRRGRGRAADPRQAELAPP